MQKLYFFSVSFGVFEVKNDKKQKQKRFISIY